MGITGLLPFLEKASKKGNVSQFSGGTVAIDSYCWLHKGAFSCADKLVMGQATDAYVKYCMKYVDMLLNNNIKPILVFDGRHLQAKAETEVKRRESRQNNRKRGAELMRMGNTAEGRNLLRRSLDITHKMALELIKECQQINVDCIVAPYEADAQLAYLNISGIADVVITEDSDLTLFGCKKVFFKMDLNGNGVLVEQERIHLAMGVHPENFNMEKFRHMCILSGCDYLPSLPGIGLMKACKFISKISDCDIQKALPRMGSYLNMKSLSVPKDYVDSFIKADVTFKHQLVYCPLQRKQVRLYPPDADITKDQLKFAGEEMEDENLAWQVALGNHDPFTLEKLHDFNPENSENRKRRTNSWVQESNSSHISIWAKSFDVNNRQVKRTNKPIQLPNSAGMVTTMKPIIIKQSRKRTYEELDDVSDEDLRKMYKEDNSKPQSEVQTARFAEAESEQKKPTSPVLTSNRNPFRKIVNDDSPSYLSKGRKKSVLRFKPTVIDNSAVARSKFFARIGEKENDDKETDEGQLSPDTVETKSMVFVEEKMEVDSDLVIVEETPCEEATMEKQENDIVDNSSTESEDLLSLYKHYINKCREENNVSPTFSDKDDYFSTEEISITSNLFQSNQKSNLSCSIVSNSQSQSARQSLTKQSSTKKTTAKKSAPLTGQTLLNQFGFQKRTAYKH